MKILQIADFHWGYQGADVATDEKTIEAMIAAIPAYVPSDDDPDLLVCICGDLVDSKPLSTGDVEESEIKIRYDCVNQLIQTKICAPLEGKGYSVTIGTCVGNHDCTHLDTMESCIKLYAHQNFRGTYTIDMGNLSVVFIHSCTADDHTIGKIDYADLESVLETKDSHREYIFVLHHTLFSMDKDDKSPIINTAKFIQILNKYQVSAVLHGHTHGQDMLQIGTYGTMIFGVGAIISRDYGDVNSQYNLLTVKHGIITEAFNWRFHKDREDMNVGSGAVSTPITLPGNRSYFDCGPLSATYDKLVAHVRAHSNIRNLVLHGQWKYDDFCQDIISPFQQQQLPYFAGSTITCERLAELWQSIQLSDTPLSFNHGERFSFVKDSVTHHGTKMLFPMLQAKPSSKRAILTSFNTKDWAKVQDDSPDGHLPSLLSIQFGLDSMKLYVTMNLRALEVENFLKINICELAFLVKKAKEYGLVFDTIDVTIQTFNAHSLKDFNCFIKAKIDCLEPVDFTNLIRDYEYGELVGMLKEKMNVTETVVLLEGLENFSHVVGKQIENLESKIHSGNTKDAPLLSILQELAPHLSSALKAYVQYQKERTIRSTNTLVATTALAEGKAALQNAITILEEAVSSYEPS